mgnify:CR=1 FL=1
MTKIISIVNQKGGVGKTTTAINLGIGLQKLNKKVLLVDLDSQANLTIGMGFDPEDISNTIADIIYEKLNDDSIKTDKSKYVLKKEGVDIIPSDMKLSGVENLMINAMNRENIMKNILEEISKDYDYVLIDCLPSLGMLTINALAAADSVIIPVQAQFYSLKGMQQLMNTIAKIKRQINKQLKIGGILITMFDKRTSLSKEVSAAVRQVYGNDIKVFDTVIGISTKAAEAPSQGKSLIKYDSKGEAAKSYLHLASEIIEVK